MLPLNNFFDRQFSKSAVFDAAAAGRAVDQRNAINPVRVLGRSHVNAKTGMIPAVLKQVAGKEFPRLGDWLSHGRLLEPNYSANRYR